MLRGFINSKGNNNKTIIKVQDANGPLNVSYQNIYETDPKRIPLINKDEQNLENFSSKQEKELFSTRWNKDKKEFTTESGQPLSIEFQVKVPTEEPSEYHIFLEFSDVDDPTGQTVVAGMQINEVSNYDYEDGDFLSSKK